MPAIAIALSSVILCWIVGGAPPMSAVELDPLFLVGIVVLAQRDLSGARSMALGGRTLGYLGTISYEFYLVHQFVLERVAALERDRSLAIPLALVTALLASALIYHVVQRPCERVLRSGARGDGLRVVMVLGCACALVPFAIPTPQLPVRNAQVIVTAAINSSGSSTVHVHGVEQVNFSAPSASAVAHFVVTNAGRPTQIEEKAVGAMVFSRSASTSIALGGTPWQETSVTTTGAFPGRPDDDPANLEQRLQALGTAVVVPRKGHGKTDLTKIRIAVNLGRSTPEELRGFNLSGDYHARTTGLTLWVLVDLNHLVRVLQYRDDLENPVSHIATRVSATFEFTHFNDGVAKVVAPPATAAAIGGSLGPILLTLFS
jgi:hypothetical protein